MHVVAGIIVGLTSGAVAPLHYSFPPDDAAIPMRFRAPTEATETSVIIHNASPRSYILHALTCAVVAANLEAIEVNQMCRRLHSCLGPHEHSR